MTHWIDTRDRLPGVGDLCEILRAHALRTPELRRWTGVHWEALDHPEDEVLPQEVVAWYPVVVRKGTSA